MKKMLIVVAALTAVIVSGCNSTTKAVAAAAEEKNVNANGYTMIAEGETATADTLTPKGRVIIGRIDYKSRKVAIGADQKTPNAAFFKATKTKSFFGVEEQVIEYDWTAETSTSAAKIEAKCETLKTAAEAKFAKMETKAETATTAEAK